MNSRKFVSKILHSPGPVPLESPSRDTPHSPGPKLAVIYLCLALLIVPLARRNTSGTSPLLSDVLRALRSVASVVSVTVGPMLATRVGASAPCAIRRCEGWHRHGHHHRRHDYRRRNHKKKRLIRTTSFFPERGDRPAPLSYGATLPLGAGAAQYPNEWFLRLLSRYKGTA
jgi:hypothetical protein